MEGIEEEVVTARPPRARSNEYLVTFAATLVVALFLKTFVVEAFRIPSASMENTLRIGDFLFVNKFIYGAETPKYLPFTAVEIPHFRLPALSAPRRGRCYCIRVPGRQGRNNPAHGINYIKRCMALPGDTLIIQDKMVHRERQRISPSGSCAAFPTERLSSPRTFFPHLSERKFVQPGLLRTGCRAVQGNEQWTFHTER